MALLMIRPALGFVALAILFQISTTLPALYRSSRHVDGLFTSRYSARRNNASVRNSLNHLLAPKRSVSGMEFPDVLGPDAAVKGEGSQFQDLCFLKLYQSFIDDSLSEVGALEAAQRSSKFICQNFVQLLEELMELSAGLQDVMSRE